MEHNAHLVVPNSQPLWNIGQHWHPTPQKVPRCSHTEFFSFLPTFWDYFLFIFFNLLLFFLLLLKCHWNSSVSFILYQNDSSLMFPTIFSLQLANNPWFHMFKPISPQRIKHFSFLWGRHGHPEVLGISETQAQILTHRFLKSSSYSYFSVSHLG